VFIASGMCLGALEVISIWLNFQVSVWGKVKTLALCEIFSNFIYNLRLFGFTSLRGRFTLSNNQDPPTKSRIDRFLLSWDWEEHFSNLSQKVMPQIVSDHCPFILDSANLSP
jgi:hypothetical protein